jgi:hypothetical protein
MRDDLEKFVLRAQLAQAKVDAMGAGPPPRKSDLAYLVTGILLGTCWQSDALGHLALRAVAEFVDGVTTGRIFLEDADGRRRVVVDVADA